MSSSRSTGGLKSTSGEKIVVEEGWKRREERD
jgi:hypothetical protein